MASNQISPTIQASGFASFTSCETAPKPEWDFIGNVEPEAIYTDLSSHHRTVDSK
jgi:hypothetical protein